MKRNSEVDWNQINYRHSETAVVVGASLCGLMTAIALAQTGLKVRVLERAGATTRSGAVLQVYSGEFDHTATAKVLRTLDSGGVRSAEAWSSRQSRLRAEAEADPKIELRYQVRVGEVNQDNSTAWAVTDTGELFRGDVLLGADGHRGTVRRHVVPHNPDATFAGYLIFCSNQQ
jgi:2-polyprenyl-6-methoxyphenol hydroxylase-like FAD-dependent oxidoreductase